MDTRSETRGLAASLRRTDGRASAKDLSGLPRTPGLYAWWVDASGARALSEGLAHRIEAGLIYAGQAGATRWPSGKPSPATLASRISTGHLGHSIDGSTFRLTLAAILRGSLALEMRSPKYLTSESERTLTGWMREHLAVSFQAVRSGRELGLLEEGVLADLDPPLNLDGMPSTPTRERLSALRRELRTSPTSLSSPLRVGLVGCVKTKGPRPTQAAELYRSALFIGRRRAVEASCDRWFVLSAKHGLVDPSRRLAPYDVTLSRMGADARRRWAALVLRQLKHAFGDLSGCTFELHAGSPYSDWGLVDGLREGGARVVRPTEGLGLGEQLAFYRDRTARRPR